MRQFSLIAPILMPTFSGDPPPLFSLQRSNLISKKRRVEVGLNVGAGQFPFDLIKSQLRANSGFKLNSRSSLMIRFLTAN